MWLTLAVGLLALAAVATLQVRAVVRARRPALKAVEALATTAPLFLLLFAAAYVLMAAADASNFNVETLTRTDSIYFTITIFATVGFGDITAASEAARILVTAQMILDLIVLGLGIRILVGAVEVGRRKPATDHKQPPVLSSRPLQLGIACSTASMALQLWRVSRPPVRPARVILRDLPSQARRHWAPTTTARTRSRSLRNPFASSDDIQGDRPARSRARAPFQPEANHTDCVMRPAKDACWLVPTMT